MGVSAVRGERVVAWHWRAPENAFLLLPLAFIVSTLPGSPPAQRLQPAARRHPQQPGLRRRPRRAATCARARPIPTSSAG